jgi:hypothetical protein
MVRLLVLLTVLATTLLGAVSAQAETTLYVGDTKEYAIAFKAEGQQLYVIELAGTTNCYYTEPHEDLGPGSFSAFAAPTLLRSDSEGLHAYDSGRGSARVRAELDGDAVQGDFTYSASELSYHCDTGFEPKPFQASLYQPIGSGGTPASGERPLYYASEGPIEIFLRVINRQAGGIRGTFVPHCRVGRAKKVPARQMLFDGPSAFTKLGEDGSFETKAVEEGWGRSGAHYKEKISLIGSVEEDAVAGTYLRIRRTRPKGKPVHRCVTGPLPFRAVRYLPPSG